jgi:hypothetical protein
LEESVSHWESTADSGPRWVDRGEPTDQAPLSATGSSEEALRVRIAELEAELATHVKHGDLIGRALADATLYAARIKEDARKEAQAILRKAGAQAREREAAAERERRELERLRQLTVKMREGLSSFLATALEGLEAGADGRPIPEGDGMITETLAEAFERPQHDGQPEQGERAVAPAPLEQGQST